MKPIAKFLGILAGILGVTFFIFGPGMFGEVLKILFWILVLGSAIPFQKFRKDEEPILYLLWSEKPSGATWPTSLMRKMPEFIWRRLGLQMLLGAINQRPYPAKGKVFSEVEVRDLETLSCNGKKIPVSGKMLINLEVVDSLTMAKVIKLKTLEKETLEALREAVTLASNGFSYSPATFKIEDYKEAVESEVNTKLANLGLKVHNLGKTSISFPSGKKALPLSKDDKTYLIEVLASSFFKGVGKLLLMFVNLLRHPLDIFRGREEIEVLGAKIRWRMGASAFTLVAYLFVFLLWSGMWRHIWLAEKVAGPAPAAQEAGQTRAPQVLEPERPSGGTVSGSLNTFHPGVFQVPPQKWGGRFRKDLESQGSFRISFKEKADQEEFYNLLEVSVLDSQNRVVRNRLRVGDWHRIPNEGVTLQVNFIDKADRAPASGIGFSVETR